MCTALKAEITMNKILVCELAVGLFGDMSKLRDSHLLHRVLPNRQSEVARLIT